MEFHIALPSNLQNYPAIKSKVHADVEKRVKISGLVIVFCTGCTVLGTHLYIKVARPGDSEETFSAFESSCHLLLPV